MLDLAEFEEFAKLSGIKDVGRSQSAVHPVHFIDHGDGARVVALHAHRDRTMASEDDNAARRQVRCQHLIQHGLTHTRFETQPADPAGTRI